MTFGDVSVGDRLIISSQRDRGLVCHGVVVRLLDQQSDLVYVELMPDEEEETGGGRLYRLYSQRKAKVMKDPNSRTFQVQDRALSSLLDEDEEFPRYFNCFLSGPDEPQATEVDLPEAMPSSLNNSQMEAVKLALRENISLIQGPPGTGKTTTAAAIVFAQCNLPPKENQGQKILVCAPSNVAVDELALRIREALPEDLLVTRVFSTCMEPWLSSSAKELGLTRLALHERSQKLREMHKTYLNNALESCDVTKYRNALKSAQEKVLRHAKVICCTSSGSACRLIRSLKGRFQLVLMDEAGQTTVPEAMVPLVATRAVKAVFIGDHKQLRPTVLSQKAQQRKLNESVLEYLVNFGFKPQVLTEQYPMPPIVAEFSNVEFYGGVLQHKAKHSFLDTLPSEKPLLMWSISSDSKKETDSNSCYNEREAKAVIVSVKALVEKANVNLRDIGVITPYRAQKRLIQSKLPAELTVSVDTVDAYQGREKDVIIISLARADTTGTQGFLKDIRRLNVMLTRARRALIVICDIQKLCLLPNDNIFIRLKGYCNRNHCVFYSSPCNNWQGGSVRANDQCYFESEVPKSTVKPNDGRIARPSKTRLLVNAVIDGKRVSALLDTGAHSSLIKRSVLNPEPSAISPGTLQIRGVTQHSVELSGLVWVDVTVGNRTGNYPLHLGSDNCAYDAILGENILETWDLHQVIAKHLNLDGRCFDRESQTTTQRVATIELHSSISLVDTLVIPPNAERFLKCKVSSGVDVGSKAFLVEPAAEKLARRGLTSCPSFVVTSSAGEMMIPVVNTSRAPSKLYRKSKICFTDAGSNRYGKLLRRLHESVRSGATSANPEIFQTIIEEVQRQQIRVEQFEVVLFLAGVNEAQRYDWDRGAYHLIGFIRQYRHCTELLSLPFPSAVDRVVPRYIQWLTAHQQRQLWRTCGHF